MTETEELPRFLDGPKFVKWLEDEEWTFYERLDDTGKRNWKRWEAGTHRPDIYSDLLDELMLDIGLPISMIPDDLWHENQVPTPGNGAGRLPVAAA